jgi:hypothetical protein
MYSIAEERLTATLPDEWLPKDVVALALHADRREPVKFDQNGRQVSINMSGRVPVMIYRNRSSARA